MKEIIFLFGAGASFGAGDIIPERPPLGSQLYSVLSKNYPRSWGNLPPEVKSRFENDNFENGMSILYEHYSQIIPELMSQMAIYMIQFRPHSGSSLYCRLIKYLHEHNLIYSTLFSTINYDCIIEFSLLGQGISISYFDEGQENKSVPVWKLHGSCNMFAKDIKASGILYSKDVVFEGGLEASLDIGTVIENCLANQSLAPAMCLYMRGKPIQISPFIILHLQCLWAYQIFNCKKLFCIGVNPWPEDKHIWEPLSSTHAHIYFIGDHEKYDRWISEKRNNPSEYIGSSFHEGITLIERSINE